MFEAKVQCPRCSQVWTVQQGMPDAECNCHLWCDRGTKPGDCSLTAVNANINWGYPTNMDVNSLNEGDDVVHRQSYCSVHGIYSYKQPIVIEVNWEKWRNTRKLPSNMKEIQSR